MKSSRPRSTSDVTKDIVNVPAAGSIHRLVPMEGTGGRHDVIPGGFGGNGGAIVGHHPNAPCVPIFRGSDPWSVVSVPSPPAPPIRLEPLLCARPCTGHSGSNGRQPTAIPEPLG